MMPSQGKSGSDSGRHKATRAGSAPRITLSSPQPPSCCRPKMVMKTEPKSSSPVCATSV